MVPAPTLAQLKDGFSSKRQKFDGAMVRKSEGTPVKALSFRNRNLNVRVGRDRGSRSRK